MGVSNFTSLSFSNLYSCNPIRAFIQQSIFQLQWKNEWTLYMVENSASDSDDSNQSVTQTCLHIHYVNWTPGGTQSAGDHKQVRLIGRELCRFSWRTSPAAARRNANVLQYELWIITATRCVLKLFLFLFFYGVKGHKSHPWPCRERWFFWST